jgi:hypothetical protein
MVDGFCWLVIFERVRGWGVIEGLSIPCDGEKLVSKLAWWEGTEERSEGYRQREEIARAMRATALRSGEA